MDKARWRYGDTNRVDAAVDSATVIEVGDLVYQNVDHAGSDLPAKPASDMRHVITAPPGSDLPDTDLAEDAPAAYLQELFADNFLGVAMQQSRSGDTDPIQVATTGVFEFDCPASKFELGDLMGVGCGYAEAGKLDKQRVDEVSKKTPGLAIARVAKRVATAATSVQVAIRSQVMTGGIAE